MRLKSGFDRLGKGGRLGERSWLSWLGEGAVHILEGLECSLLFNEPRPAPKE